MTAAPTRLRLPRALRLKHEREFRRVYREGTRMRGEHMTVVLLPNELGHPRLGLSVGKRCWKSAVKRNRVRRVFREAFRLAQRELGEGGVDVVLVGSTPRLEPRLEPVRLELVDLVARARARRARRSRPEEKERARALGSDGDRRGPAEESP